MTSLLCDDKNQSRSDSLPAACTLLSLRTTLPRTTSSSSGSISPTWYVVDDAGLQKKHHDEKRRINLKLQHDQHDRQDQHNRDLHELNANHTPLSSTCSSRATTPRSAFWNTVMAPLPSVNLQPHFQPTVLSFPAQSPAPLDSFNSRQPFALQSDPIDAISNLVDSNATTASTNLTTCSSTVSVPEHPIEHRHHHLHHHHAHGHHAQQEKPSHYSQQCQSHSRKHSNSQSQSHSNSHSYSHPHAHTHPKSQTEPIYTSEHMATQNNQVAPSMNIPCIVCGVRFRKLGHLNMHWRSVHARRDPNTNCTNVPKFTQQSSHSNHPPTHTNPPASPRCKPTLPHCTNYNGGSISQKPELDDNYQRSISVDPKLKIVSVRSSVLSQCNAAQSIVNGAVIKPNRAYGCPQCEASFRRGSDRNRHMRMVHAKIRPFECPMCGNHFGRKSFLEAHILTVHHKLRPFRCSCGAAFGQRSSLTRHTRKIHGREPI